MENVQEKGGRKELSVGFLSWSWSVYPSGFQVRGLQLPTQSLLGLQVHIERFDSWVFICVWGLPSLGLFMSALRPSMSPMKTRPGSSAFCPTQSSVLADKGHPVYVVALGASSGLRCFPFESSGFKSLSICLLGPCIHYGHHRTGQPDRGTALQRLFW